MPEINLKNSAVLIMDTQTGIVANWAKDQTMPERAARVLEAARKARIPVIHVIAGMRKGSSLTPEMAQIHPAVAPQEDDIIVTKKRVSGFSGSDLDLVLRKNRIEQVILMGIATSGVVLSTLRQAYDLDYRAAVISDCCSDLDDEVHRVLTQKVFPRQATVLTSKEFLAAVGK